MIIIKFSKLYLHPLALAISIPDKETKIKICTMTEHGEILAATRHLTPAAINSIEKVIKGT